MERVMDAVLNVRKGVTSLPARLTDWLNSYCLITFCCFLFLVFVHVTLSMSFFRITAICLSATSVVENHESKQPSFFQALVNCNCPVYRLFTYTLFHTNWIHLAFNMVFLSSVGNSVEKRLGSIYLLNMLILFSVFCAIVQLIISVFLATIFPSMAFSCVAGFSGVLFAVLVLEVRVSKNKRQSIYGMCSVPRSTYPWLLLIGCQVMTLQNVSLIGHLSGIITGYMCILSNLCYIVTNFVSALLHPSTIYHLVSYDSH